ncbi:MAG: nitrate reductase molybdenum cofactor assembly chaperone [Bacteroidales bacterium]|nr:nitrate reductase molybdenum cofactor assembly chaperone [Bacteroidales bacterium]
MLKTYRILSLLLTYPNEEIYNFLPEVNTSLKEEKLLNSESIIGIDAFVDFFNKKQLPFWQEHYVQLFDYSKSASLYLFEHVHGDSKDRGQAMVDLIDLYKENGLQINRSELPDYLPMFLEFIALQTQAKAEDFLSEIIDIVGFIHRKLDEKDNPYKHLLAAIIQLSKRKPAEARIAKMVSEMPEITIDEAYEEVPVTFGSENPCVNCKS